MNNQTGKKTHEKERGSTFLLDLDLCKALGMVLISKLEKYRSDIWTVMWLKNYGWSQPEGCVPRGWRSLLMFCLFVFFFSLRMCIHFSSVLYVQHEAHFKMQLKYL